MGARIRVRLAVRACVELRLLFDLVCFGLLIKHALCFVGGASQSGEHSSHTPSIHSSLTGVH